MRIPVVGGDLYTSNPEIVLENDVLYIGSDERRGSWNTIDIPAIERDLRLAKVHGCNPGECRDLSHNWRHRDAERAASKPQPTE